MVAGRVTIPGTLADSVAVNPPGPAGLVTDKIARAAVPPVTTFGKKPMLCSAAGGGTGDTVTVAAFEELLYEAVIVTGVSAVTTDVAAVAVPLCAPVGIVKLAGTLNTAGLLLVRATTAPVP